MDPYVMFGYWAEIFSWCATAYGEWWKVPSSYATTKTFWYLRLCARNTLAHPLPLYSLLIFKSNFHISGRIVAMMKVDQQRWALPSSFPPKAIMSFSVMGWPNTQCVFHAKASLPITAQSQILLMVIYQLYNSCILISTSYVQIAQCVCKYMGRGENKNT